MGGLTHATENGVMLWRPASTTAMPWLQACVTTRHGGTSASPYDALNLSLAVGDDPQRVQANRTRLQATLGLTGIPLVQLSQVHGTRIWKARDPAAREGDGWWTDTPGQVLVVGVADCVPIFVWDERTRRLALLHAGWRGTAAGILGVALDDFAAAGSRPEDLRVALGPCIGPCCYPVHSSVAAHFPAAAVVPRDGTPHLDLRTANRLQAESHGLQPTQVEANPPCTACAPATFFSHRKTGPKTGRMWALAWLLALAALAGCGRSPEDRVTRAGHAISLSQVQAHGRWLTADALAGRHFASADADSAASYLVSELRRAGIHPTAHADDLFGSQPAVFTHTFSMTLYRLGAHNAMALVRGTHTTNIRLGEDWMPVVFGRSGRVTAPIVRVSELPADAVRGSMTLGGKIAVVQARDLTRGRGTESLEALLYRTARRLQASGALAVVVGGPVALLGSPGASFPEQLPPELRAAVRSSRGAAVNLLADRLCLAAQAEAWAAAPEPTIPLLLGHNGWVETLLPGDILEISVDVRPEVALAENVLVGFRGQQHPDELIVLGAGYDHTGVNGAGDVLNGADDNASGTVALLGAAIALAQVHDALQRSVLIAFFAAGRAGLQGSEALLHDLASLTGSAAHPVAMLALRGVGRNGTEPLLVVGGAGQPHLVSVLARADHAAVPAGDSLGLRLTGEETTPFGRLEVMPSRGSEHVSFVRAGVPSVLLTDGLDPAFYGQPEDDWSLVDAAKVTRVARLVFHAAYALATAESMDAVPAAVPGR